MTDLRRSRALWNRSHLVLESDETLAQILDRGSVDDWRALYALAARDARLRGRLVEVIRRVPLPAPRLWLAGLAALGEPIDLGMTLPRYDDSGT